MGLQRLLSVFRGHPLLLVVMAGAFSGSIILGYRNIVKPYGERRRRAKAEMYAEILFQKELKDEAETQEY